MRSNLAWTLSLTLLAAACGGDDGNSAAPELIPGGGVHDPGIDGLVNVLAMPLPPTTLANLVAYDANRGLDDPGDEGARVWLADLLRDLQKWRGQP